MSFHSGHAVNQIFPYFTTAAMIAVYIDSLVMISIERSETAKKMHWMSETN